MPAIEKDFDRLALLDSDGWTHNNHYHKFLLRHVPEGCRHALEIGCGTGAFARRLAERAKNVIALDLSRQMIRVARSRSAKFPNIQFQVADVAHWDFPAEHFDCIATIATLHHVQPGEVLLKMKAALRSGGVLMVLDLFEPEGLVDSLANIVAMGASGTLRLINNGRLKLPREVQAAWEEHGQHDSYPTMREVRGLCADILFGAKVKQHLLWRYSIVWKK